MAAKFQVRPSQHQTSEIMALFYEPCERRANARLTAARQPRMCPIMPIPAGPGERRDQ
jgi:hypothetical protein